MEPAPKGEITLLLTEIRNGNRSAESRLAEVVYVELHHIADRHMRRERPDHSLQPTVLVHEAFLHLVERGDRTWQNRSHFFAVAAQVMRHLLIDHARSRKADKRGGGMHRVELDGALAVTAGNCVDLLALDEALTRLAALDARQSRIVELRFFGGLTEEEIAEILGVTSRTVKREWMVAKAWLHGELSSKLPR